MPDADARLFFLHIPKTAGTTLAGVIEQRFHESTIVPRRLFGKNALYVTPDDVAGRVDEMRGYTLIRGHYGGPVRERFFADMPSLTVLREPRARVVSLYNDWRTKSEENLADAPPAERDLARLARECPLGEFLRSGNQLVDRLFTDAQARQLTGFLWETTDPDPDDTRAALDRFTFVGVTDMLDLTVSALSRLLGWHPPAATPRLNASRGDTTIADLDAGTLAEIDKRTRVDRVAYDHARMILSAKAASLLDDRSGIAPGDPRVPGASVIDMRDPLDGSGWHVREGLDTPRVWRWTGPERESTVVLHAPPGRPHRLRVSVISVIASDVLDGAHFLVNGRAVAIDEREERDGQIELGARVPAWMIGEGRRAVVSVLVPRTLSHADLDPETPDTRQKGLAITRIGLEPA